MTPEHWQQIARIYQLAVDCDPAARDSFLSDACAGDEALRQEVESLLREEGAHAVLDRPVWATAASLFDTGPELRPGTLLGPYRIEGPLGAGGMGEVFSGTDTRLSRRVAIKVLLSSTALDQQMRARFAREARAVAALTHPHICTLYDVGRHGEIDFLVMEYLEGKTLASRLRDRQLPLDEALTRAIEIASALDHAHRQGIVHRDLKPGNIMLTGTGAKLLDFGLAKFRSDLATAADIDAPRAETTADTAGRPSTDVDDAPVTGGGAVLGTLRYMAPEQIEGREVDARSDLFSFAAVLHEMLTGTRAFEGDHAARVRVAILEDEPPRVSSLQPLAPAALDDLVHRGLAKNPDERWQSASEILRELTRISVALSPTRTHSWPVLRWIASLRNGEGRRARVIVSAMVLSSLVAAVMVYQLRPRDSANPLTSVAVLPSVNASGNSQHSSRAQPRDTANPQAYRSYLNGLFHHAKGTPDNVRAAIDDFQRALASDPGFALAWTGLSTGALTLAGDSIAHPVEPLATAHAAALKAVELDPTLADAHLLLGEIASSEWDWAGAEREYQRALELSPGLVRVHAAYAAHLAMTGRPRQALDVVPLIRRLDPMNTRLTGIEGHLLYLAGRFDESIELLRQSVDLGNANSLFFLAAAYDAKQQHHLAVDQYLALIHRFGDNPSNLVFLGYALARAGQREQATAILERVKTTAAYVSPAELAVLYVGLGDREGAFAALEDAYAARDLQLKWLKVEHHYDDLRDDPRFRDLERRVGL